MGKGGWTGGFIASLRCCPVIVLSPRGEQSMLAAGGDCSGLKASDRLGNLVPSVKKKKKRLHALVLINISRILLKEMGSRDVPFKYCQ